MRTESKRDVIAILTLILITMSALWGATVLTSSVTIDFSSPLLAVTLSDMEVVHQTQKYFLPVTFAGEKTEKRLSDTRISGGTLSFTVDGAGTEVNLMASSAGSPLFMTLVKGEISEGPFYVNGSSKKVLGPVNNTFDTYEIYYDLVDGETETVSYTVDFSLE